MLYHLLIRPWLFRLEAERSHQVALSLLDKSSIFRSAVVFNQQPTEVMGIRFPNRVGLAAGLDKNALHIASLGKLGFGFIEVGTVTPLPQSGNPKPRLFRLAADEAIINRMGFNNNGVDALVEQVKRSRHRYPGVLGINIGKNKDTPNERALDDYLIGLQKVYAYADYITVNISSPNTAGLRDLQAGEAIKCLLAGLKEEQNRLAGEHGYKPIAVKIAPDLTDDAIIELAWIFKQFEVDGIIATNTTIDKSAVANSQYAGEAGGLSGVPLGAQSTHVIKVLADALNGQIPIIGVGGINSGEDALDKLRAGASLIQLYSGLIYQGPQLITSAINACSQLKSE